MAHECGEDVWKSQRGFTTGKSCLSNLIAICDKVAGLMNKGRAQDNTCLDFKKALIMSHNLIVYMLGRYDPDG